MKNATQRLPTQSLTEEIVEWINEEIREQRLKPGDKLPSEKQLGEQFSVSRSVVREALSQLKSEGIVNAQQGRGAFVNERGSRQAFRFEAAALNDAEGLEHVIELLVTLETAAARYAAIRRTPEDLKKIKKALVGMEYAIINDKLGDEEDFAFHQAIVDSTKNPHFCMLNEYLEQHVRRLIRQARSNTATNYNNLIQAVQDEHKAILQAIEDKDPVAAAIAAETHLRNAAKRLNKYLS
ncbi:MULTISPECIES: FadR/GntR family transcriptional regulator [Herbaspirillum]|uniref:FadR/GntR family transcriptional regulator n=1 Tax=Herbaspirillum TaxID=963 RepID=UPI001F52534E|nr:FadR/GntR family transcriptional regulator [Herbaspirillum sp. C7C2]MCI1013221.1 FadR family transcriptional regulator [Herbaspirillum sp. C7C2]